MKTKIKKGDMVVVISGKDRGKNAKVINVFPKEERIVVEGVAMKKVHRRPRKQGQKGEVVSLPSPIHSSNVLLYCKNCGKGSRAGFKFLDDGKKVRICKKCKNEI
ncbi:50S ribosomal protein L24 [Candidatus Giovannonibacteria bacterium RIFCSPHIGHO2_01_FULL_45_33]|uniref:Large ribosomal subunit protein uL24 n=1 Tax=Candidatus Giovannonibacteria bacterium RIFCSPLOWO2_01_FULL_45_34 TaxID=1798351 RepID=A0A1F5X058_9BACT|nr:MAG: 50S ribosomal protein L24 [Candidatus Giovannonibacteria bacterium RIFCSPHIGHO2_01_FULL_45_33]OGF69307.1 MAG: 50S ribosomal protein L24 [Candidatus Giovannonibacteria bacterium RIFCSPHIGHO2_02_FULL_44_11]OGF81277.1 MAG: 50S ribosomal protein L24 [Candidatus Giovannonibacteria bacterium RIFCSPLOWO2_01_FULL_45_34]